MSTYQYIVQRAGQVPVHQLCQGLCISPDAYSAWQRRQQVSMVESAWQVAVREVFIYHSQRYSTCRLHAYGHAVGRWRIRRVLHGLRGQQP